MNYRELKVQPSTLVIALSSMKSDVEAVAPNAQIFEVENFVQSKKYEVLVEQLKHQK